MRRTTAMLRPFIVAAFATVALAGSASAQLPPVDSPALLSAFARAELEAENGDAGSGVQRHVLHAAVGALIGAGVGYFASQVVFSDWDKASNSTFLDQRRTYSLGGAAVGAVVGVFAGRHRGSARGPLAVAPIRDEAAGIETISREEIAGASVVSAYEVVQLLHPEWLIVRGRKHFHEDAEAAGGAEWTALMAETSEVRAYLNRAELEDVEALRRVLTADLDAIRFLSPGQATYRFGAGHAQGAIVVQTKGSQP